MSVVRWGRFIIIIINPLTARVVGAPQMILQPVFSIFPCSPLSSGTCRTPGLSGKIIPHYCLFVCCIAYLFDYFVCMFACLNFCSVLGLPGNITTLGLYEKKEKVRIKTVTSQPKVEPVSSCFRINGSYVPWWEHFYWTCSQARLLCKRVD